MTVREHWAIPKQDLLEAAFSYSLKLEEENLVFSITAPLPAEGKSAYPLPGFVKGLWRMDCAELFVGNTRGGRYAEFNLSAGGGWWSCVFSAPRRAWLEEDWWVEGMQADASWHENHWRGSLKVPLFPLATILGEADWHQWTGNVTFLAGCGDQQRYFSAAAFTNARPDFHQPDCWPGLGQLMGAQPGLAE